MNPPGDHHSRLLRKRSPVSDGANAAPVADPIRVILIDDSLTVRTVLKRMVESDPGMVVADTASSAERGIAQLKNAAVDVILLDLEMPGMGGLVALPDILAAAPDAQVMVVSSLTEDGAQATVEALSQGAADTMLKPRPGGFNEEYRSQLLGKIRALGSSIPDAGIDQTNAASTREPIRIRTNKRRSKRPEILAVGASTGGIHALNVMLRALTPAFDLPILITQHLPASFIPVFARQIEVASGRPTRIADEGTEIRQGEIVIASGEGHMTLRRVGDRVLTRVVSERAASGCLPSVDPMLASLATVYEGRALAVILSGMGRDGLQGAQLLVEAGGAIWAQDADTSAVWGMPGAVAKAGLTSMIAAPQMLGEAIMAEFSSAHCAGAAAVRA